MLNCYGSRKYQYQVGESKTGIEIKFDKRSKETHNLYIEYAEKRSDSNIYVSSGIERNDNTWLYCIGDYETLYLIPKNRLKALKNDPSLEHKTTRTSKGYLLPCEKASGIAAKVIRIEKKGV